MSRKQDAFNLEPPPVVVTPATFADAEAVAALRSASLRLSRDNLMATTLLHEINRNFDQRIFDEAAAAMMFPTIYDLDFLAMTTRPFAGLRALWKFAAGIGDEVFERDDYATQCLMQIAPLDVIGLWLQAQAKWRRAWPPPSFYSPFVEDYFEIPGMEAAFEDTTVVVYTGTTQHVMSRIERIDRWFLSSAGIYVDWTELDIGNAGVIQYAGKWRGKSSQVELDITSPMFPAQVKPYIEGLIRGRILPFNYRTILERYNSHVSTFEDRLAIRAIGNRSDPEK